MQSNYLSIKELRKTLNVNTLTKSLEGEIPRHKD